MIKNRNAGLIRIGDESHDHRFSVTVEHGSSLFPGARMVMVRWPSSPVRT